MANSRACCWGSDSVARGGDGVARGGDSVARGAIIGRPALNRALSVYYV